MKKILLRLLRLVAPGCCFCAHNKKEGTGNITCGPLFLVTSSSPIGARRAPLQLCRRAKFNNQTRGYLDISLDGCSFQLPLPCSRLDICFKNTIFMRDGHVYNTFSWCVHDLRKTVFSLAFGQSYIWFFEFCRGVPDVRWGRGRHQFHRIRLEKLEHRLPTPHRSILIPIP